MKKIALIGFGCVGQGLYRILAQSESPLAEIKRIVVRDRTKKRIAPPDLITYAVEDVLEDPEIEIIIEAIDDATAALSIARRALNAGKSFITANKKMLAGNLDELHGLAQSRGLALRYEAAVCGSIPVVQTIDAFFAKDRVRSIRGIFNGTSNYILSKIFNEGQSYQAALKEAQELGYAESDPTADVGGFDAKYKLILLAYHAFGIHLTPQEILNYGIEYLNDADIAYARERGWKIKLLPTAYSADGEFFGSVLPEFVPGNDHLFNVDYEFNAVTIESVYAGQQLYYGRGAGSFPTAAAIVSDLQKALSGEAYNLNRSRQIPVMTAEDDVLIEVYTRFSNAAIQRVLKFRSLTSGQITEHSRQLTGFVSLKDLRQVVHVLKREKVSIVATGRRKLWQRAEEGVKQEQVLQLEKQ